ncbi:hypothetical protein EJ08DRAFT_728518 [Tothia fuscella]|uniref:RING-type domain-containing protein n=1 Tax=Tothia fuscella TaxID=1048955 RepID=A0A9P4U3E6_9PEZI|nr:hypothetical protein EJ08DRAFT_728518 [Tothia fuscella]
MAAISAPVLEDVVDAAPMGDWEEDLACVICGNIYDDIYNLHICADHVWCIDCAKSQFEKAILEDISMFPVNCDGRQHPLSIDTIKHLFPVDLVKRYNLKLAETFSPLKVYCSNVACSRFLVPKTHIQVEGTYNHNNGNFSAGSTYAKCADCETTTCVGCGASWLPDHFCKFEAGSIELPPYSRDLRIKQCPKCNAVIELKEACNHMTFTCNHQFCFVCLVSWNDHRADCPQYGDPEYDEEMRDARALHVRTGRDRNGLDSNGNGNGEWDFLEPSDPSWTVAPEWEEESDYDSDTWHEFRIDETVRQLRETRDEELLTSLPNLNGIHCDGHDWRRCYEPKDLKYFCCEICGVDEPRFYLCYKCGAETCYSCSFEWDDLDDGISFMVDCAEGWAEEQYNEKHPFERDDMASNAFATEDIFHINDLMGSLEAEYEMSRQGIVELSILRRDKSSIVYATFNFADMGHRFGFKLLAEREDQDENGDLEEYRKLPKYVDMDWKGEEFMSNDDVVADEHMDIREKVVV